MPDWSATLRAVPDPILPPFQLLSDRLAGLPVDETLHEGVPNWLDIPLREWLVGILRGQEEVARRVMLRLRWPRRADRSYSGSLGTCDRSDLLDVVDAVLQLHPGWAWLTPQERVRHYREAEAFAAALIELKAHLYDAGSLYDLDVDEHRLTRRVDPTVRDAADRVVNSAPTTAATHLRSAWTAAYGLHPDPTTAYRDAVRAVEAVACPLVLPNADKPTLGTMRDHLRDAGHKWQIALVNKDDDPDVTPLVAMLERLWTGQVSRHGGGRNFREQTQAEAEAAVHLAATLVHWLSTGVLTKR